MKIARTSVTKHPFGHLLQARILGRYSYPLPQVCVNARERRGVGQPTPLSHLALLPSLPPGIQVEMAREITPGAKRGDHRLPCPSWNARVSVEEVASGSDFHVIVKVIACDNYTPLTFDGIPPGHSFLYTPHHKTIQH